MIHQVSIIAFDLFIGLSAYEIPNLYKKCLPPPILLWKQNVYYLHWQKPELHLEYKIHLTGSDSVRKITAKEAHMNIL